MKKITAIVLTLIMVFALCACGSNSQNVQSAPATNATILPSITKGDSQNDRYMYDVELVEAMVDSAGDTGNFYRGYEINDGMLIFKFSCDGLIEECYSNSRDWRECCQGLTEIASNFQSVLKWDEGAGDMITFTMLNDRNTDSFIFMTVYAGNTTMGCDLVNDVDYF